jgi:class 3 adenylate cyclase/predicted ATPase
MSRGNGSNLFRYVPRPSAEWGLHTDEPWWELEGTLCYVDISGFTSLSEKLARRGRVGAEELTEVLNLVFGRMLTVAYDRGGSLLKFGGDALLLLFSHPDHPVHACGAAVEMQRVLREASSHRSSAGRLNLKMSVGLHTGIVHLFRVGESHQELIITGPAASTTAEMEETAVAGEILISPELRAGIPSGSAPKRKGAGWLLGWRKPREEVPGWTPREPVSPEAIVAGVPVALREHLSQGFVEPEHHIATVGFIKFTGVDELMENRGPRATAQALAELVGNVQEAVDEEGVTFLASDIDQDGGKIIIVAGVPNVQEDDEGRVLRAARRIADRGGQLPLEVGINRGHVFVGEIGTEFRATYTIMGDTVNLAARLMAAAPPGEVYASPSALDLSLTLFDTTPLPPFHVKGKEQPVQAYAVGAETGSRRSHGGSELPFVGRREELDELDSIVDTLYAGTGDAVAIVGERGAGKSRLVDEILPELSRAVRVDIRAEPYGTRTPYRPLRDPVRRLLGIERDDTASMARSLEAAVSRIAPERASLVPLLADVVMIETADTPEVELIEPRFRQDRTADLLIELIPRIHPGPVFFEVEDGHYVDEASATILKRLVNATKDHPWLVLTTRRDTGEGFDPGRRTINLPPLSPDEARELVLAATEGAPLLPQDVDAVVQRSGGLPLFIEEIVLVVRDTGTIDALPESLDAVVSSQIDALPSLARRLLQFSSVLGRSFREGILNRLLENEDVRLDRATRRQLEGFLESDGRGRLRFRHGMIRDVAYEGLSFRRRRELHLRAGEVAERDAGDSPEAAADVLALHFFLGHDHPRAWRYARVAGDQARDTYANNDAAVQYERALASARRLSDVADRERLAVLISLGDVSERAGRFDEALDAYRRASRLVGDDAYERIEILLKRAQVRRRSSAYSAALRETSEGLRLLNGDTSAAAIRARGRLTAERGKIRAWQQRPADALRLAQAAEIDARSVEDLETLAEALDRIDWAHRMMGETDRAVHYPETLAIVEQIGDMSRVAQVWNNLGADAFWEGRWADAIDAYTKSRDAEFRTGNAVDAAISDANIAELLINQGRLDDAEPLLTDAIRVLKASGHVPAATFAESELARLLIRRSDHAAARRLLWEIQARSEAIGERMSAVNAMVQLADSELRQGRSDEALRLLEEAESQAGEMVEPFVPVVARLTAGALGALGRIDAALDRIDDGLAVARGQGLMYDEALLLAARAEVVSGAGGVPDPDDRAIADRLFAEMDVVR